MFFFTQIAFCILIKSERVSEITPTIITRHTITIRAIWKAEESAIFALNIESTVSVDKKSKGILARALATESAMLSVARIAINALNPPQRK